MTQIVVTLEEGSNLSIVRNAIKMIKGVKNAIVTHLETESDQRNKAQRLKAFDKLAGCVTLDMVNTEDERTKYLLSK